jgi:alpha-tubulin suppressor-like RCC1 family protein
LELGVPLDSVVDGSVPYAVQSNFGGGASAISVSECQSCVLADGGAECWGTDLCSSRGVLGVPDASTATAIPFDIGASGGGVVVQVIAGQQSTCAVDVSHHVYCSGDNTYGEIGQNGVGSTRSTPGVVSDFENLGVTQLALGSQHTCVVQGDTTVACLGSNEEGQLGRGTFSDAGSQGLAPVVWPDGGLLTGALSVAAGGVTFYGTVAHSCAILRPAACATWGTVVCWGSNDNGQLGDGTLTSRGYPTPVLAPQ